MADPEQQTETVSREALEREKRRADAAEEKLADATRALGDFAKRDRARAFFRDKVSDPDGIADLVTPHLRDVELEKVSEILATDRFKPLLATAAPASPTGEPSANGEPATEPATEPAVEQPGGFGNPSPGGVNGTQPVTTTTKIKVGDEAYQAAVRANNVEQIEAWEKAGLLEHPAQPW